MEGIERDNNERWNNQEYSYSAWKSHKTGTSTTSGGQVSTTGLIVGSVVGVILFIIGCCWCYCKCRNKRQNGNITYSAPPGVTYTPPTTTTGTITYTSPTTATVQTTYTPLQPANGYSPGITYYSPSPYAPTTYMPSPNMVPPAPASSHHPYPLNPPSPYPRPASPSNPNYPATSGPNTIYTGIAPSAPAPDKESTCPYPPSSAPYPSSPTYTPYPSSPAYAPYPSSPSCPYPKSPSVPSSGVVSAPSAPADMPPPTYDTVVTASGTGTNTHSSQ